MAPHRLTSLAGGLVLAFSLGACGGGTTTVVERTVTAPPVTVTETTGTGTTAQPTAGPRGALDFTAIGPLQQGDPISRAQQLFGAPDKLQRNAGCELAPATKSQTSVTWSLRDGDVFVQFERHGGMVSYRTTSKQLPTTAGNRVGDRFAGLRDSWGTGLVPLNVGARSTPRSGFWVVKEGPRAELTFDIGGGRIKSISGGYTPVCE